MLYFAGLELSPFWFLCVAAASTCVSWVVAYFLCGPADRLNLVSKRRRDRFGEGRIPLTGGPGLLLGCAAALLALGTLPDAATLTCALGFFGVGLLDDLIELSPARKFALQGAVALACALLLTSGAALVGLVLLILLVIVNASNYLDNMDALLPGVALTQAIAITLLVPGQGVGGTLLFWALPGVLFLTFRPARVYLGDSGSHLVGALLALDFARHLISPTGLRPRFILPLLLVFSVPLLDAAIVTLSRIRRKRPLFRGGTDHLSHRLVRLGWPVRGAVGLLVLASAVCGVAALLLVHSS